MPRLTEPTGFLYNLLDNVLLYAFSGFALSGFLFVVLATLSTEVFAHIFGKFPTSLAPLPVAASPILRPIALAIIPFASPSTPFRLGAIRFATSHTGLSTLGSLDRFVQSVLLSSFLF